MYDGQSIDDIPDHRDVEPPLKDMYVLTCICINFNLEMLYSLGHWHGYLYDNEGVRKEGESMMTFVLIPAKGEQQIKADAWSLKGRYTITGSWSKDDGVIWIKLKMTFLAAAWDPKFFSGHFDSERDALTGVWGSSAELQNYTDKMECRRIAPRYLAVYPNIKELSDNKPRALWGFTIAVIRNDVRRDHWSWTHFSRRRDDRNKIVPLLVRSRHFGPPLSEEDTQTLHGIVLGLTSADACFYDSKANHIRAHTWVHE